MLVVVDYREKYILEKFKQPMEIDKTYEICLDGFGVVSVKVSNLAVGDFIIQDGDDIKLIIERKTLTDLQSSITDGRFREQKHRLSESVNSDKVLYIIEGSKKQCPKSIDGAIVNLLFKHDFKVLQTTCLDDTFSKLMLIYKKFRDGELSKTTVCTPVSLKFKRDQIESHKFAVQLSTIPGVSFSVAQVISRTYPSMKALVDKYNECGSVENKANMLSVIQITEKRKIGVALSTKIYEYIH